MSIDTEFVRRFLSAERQAKDLEQALCRALSLTGADVNLFVSAASKPGCGESSSLVVEDKPKIEGGMVCSNRWSAKKAAEYIHENLRLGPKEFLHAAQGSGSDFLVTTDLKAPNLQFIFKFGSYDEFQQAIRSCWPEDPSKKNPPRSENAKALALRLPSR